jgi:hypothetical protein
MSERIRVAVGVPGKPHAPFVHTNQAEIQCIPSVVAQGSFSCGGRMDVALRNSAELTAEPAYRRRSALAQ